MMPMEPNSNEVRSDVIDRRNWSMGDRLVICELVLVLLLLMLTFALLVDKKDDLLLSWLFFSAVAAEEVRCRD